MKLKHLAFFALSLVVFFNIFPRLQTIGLFRKNEPYKKLDTCKKIPMKMCEDIITLFEVEVAILSCNPGRLKYNPVMGVVPKDGNFTLDGFLAIYDLTYPEASPHVLSLEGYSSADGIYPLGIQYLYDTKSQTAELYMTNILPTGATIEVFELDFNLLIANEGLDTLPKTLKHLRTIKDPLIKTPNSIALLGKDEFFVSNDHSFTLEDAPFARLFEKYLTLPIGSVIHYNKGKALIVAHGFSFTNGVALSPNRKVLYVAETMAGTLHAFEVTGKKTLKTLKPMRLGYAIDNVAVDPTTGYVYVSGHPRIFQLLALAKNKTLPFGLGDPSKPAPSKVVRLIAPPQELHLMTTEEARNMGYSEFHLKYNQWRSEVLFYDDGEYFGSSSVAEPFNNKRLLVGSLYGDSILDCQIEPTTMRHAYQEAQELGYGYDDEQGDEDKETSSPSHEQDEL